MRHEARHVVLINCLCRPLFPQEPLRVLPTSPCTAMYHFIPHFALSRDGSVNTLPVTLPRVTYMSACGFLLTRLDSRHRVYVVLLSSSGRLQAQDTTPGYDQKSISKTDTIPRGERKR